jgi:hypothetical protein
MDDVAQELEDLLQELSSIQKTVNKLPTKSVSGTALRSQMRTLHKRWLKVSGVLEASGQVNQEDVHTTNESWVRLVKLSQGLNLKRHYKLALKNIITSTEEGLLHTVIKRSGLQSAGGALRKLIAPVSDAQLLKYLDESVRCAEANCIRGSVVLAWCAVASRMHRKLVSLGLPALEGHFDKMRLDTGLMFKSFQRAYKISTPPDVQEIPDAYLILMCRFLTWLDDTEYKHLKAALDLRNGCGHPSGYEPDAVKLQAYYSDIAQLVLMNPKFN